MTRLLLALSLLFFCTFAQAQTTDAPSSFFRVYLDAELGLLSQSGDGISPLGISSISTGFRINRQFALGLGLRSWFKPSSCCAIGANGLGLQLRYSPTNQPFLIKVETGYVLGASYADDGSYISKHNPDKSNKSYVSFSVAARFAKICMLGIAYANTTNQVNENFKYNTTELLGTSQFGVSAISLVFGVTFPKYRKLKEVDTHKVDLLD
jgi:hypothetical protein